MHTDQTLVVVVVLGILAMNLAKMSDSDSELSQSIGHRDCRAAGNAMTWILLNSRIPLLRG